MTDRIILIDIVAHRVFGTRHRWVETQITRHAPAPVWEHELEEPRRLLMAFPDYEHGTERSEAEVTALFSRDPAYDYPDGQELNDIFMESGVRFRLLAVLDAMVANHVADFIPRDSLRGIARQNNVPYALDVYFAKELHGADGTAETYSRDYRHPSYAFVSDLRGAFGGFARSVMVLAHELGHVLSLPHMPGSDNVMYNYGGSRNAGLSAVQGHLARHHAQLMRRTALASDAALERTLPRHDHFRDWYAPLDSE